VSTAEGVAGPVRIDITEKEKEIVYITPVEPTATPALEDDHQHNDHQQDDHHHHSSHGEHLWVDERLVVSPASGRFWKQDEESVPENGEFLIAGDVVGHVVGPDGRPVEVRSPFSGWAMGFLIPNGSPVKNSEPVLWLRTV
jgi:hypothetical protein